MPNQLRLMHPLRSTAFPITQKFGENPQWYPLTNGHNGIDYGIPLRTPIYATLSGTVVRVAADPSGYGNHIRISHADNLLSLYGHLDESNYHTVQVGDEVQAGKQIGFSGNTGRSTGPHLHFEIRRGSTAFDPLPFITLDQPVVIEEEEGEEERIITPPPPPPTIKFRVCVTDAAQPHLNVRSGPDLLYPIIGHLMPGEEVDVLNIAGNAVWLQTPKGFIALRFDGTDLAEILRPGI